MDHSGLKSKKEIGKLQRERNIFEELLYRNDHEWNNSVV